MSNSNLREARLFGTNLVGADLREANFEESEFGETILGNTDLTGSTKLETSIHLSATIIDDKTLFRSRLPVSFLRGCGLPDSLINSLMTISPVDEEFYTCFISYSHTDREFALRLHDKLQGRGIRCWLDEKQLKPGQDIYEEVDRGIRHRDKVLLCCSERSLTSWWCDNEIATALEKEQVLTRQLGRKVQTIIPLNLDGYLFSDRWRSGYRAQLRRRLAADFTCWETDNAKFERELQSVIHALRAADRSDVRRAASQY
jgi:hypothetical protein